MTSEQVRNLVAMAAANFPATQEKNMAPTAELWYRTLSDMPYPLLEAALIKVLTIAKYFPTVAEIRQASSELSAGETISPASAWNMVISAINRYGYYNAKKAIDSLPPIVRKAVECFGWAELCHTESPEIIRSQFLRIYEQIAKKEGVMSALPAALKQPGKKGELPCAT